MKKVQSLILNDFLKVSPGFGRRTVNICIVEIFTGFFLSFLIEVNYGTDPCTFLNLNLSARTGISFGSCQVLVNVILFVLVIALTRFQYMGVGTLANMFLIGYSSDFFRWLWGTTLRDDFFTSYPERIIFFIVGLIGFILCCAVYMNFGMGMVPYDATPCIIQNHLKKIPPTLIRMCWDFGMIGIGCLLGGTPPLGTIILAVALGPTISSVGKLMKKSPRG